MMRFMRSQKKISQEKAELARGSSLLVPVWDTIELKKISTYPSSTGQVVLMGGTEENRLEIEKYFPKIYLLNINCEDTIQTISEKLNNASEIKHIIWILPDQKPINMEDEALIDGQESGIILIFRTIKALLNLGYGTKVLFWSVIATQVQSIYKDEKLNPIHSSVIGLIGSMAKEYPIWKVGFTDLELGCKLPLDDIFKLFEESNGDVLAFRGGLWHRQSLIPVSYPAIRETRYREGGVYVVIGGAGGIGEAWSEYMISTYRAKIIWLGRRAIDKSVQTKIEKLGAMLHGIFQLTQGIKRR